MRRRGFTLVELVVVLIILAVAAGIGAPAFARLESEEDRMIVAAMDVTRLLDASRRMAVERGARVVLSLVPETGRYRAVADPDFARQPAGAGRIELPADVVLESSASVAHLVFEPHGPARADTLRVRSAGAVALILVEPWTGRTHVRRE